MKVEIGGHRLGNTGKMETELHGYGHSTHNLSYAWRSSMAPGVLIPFMVEPLTNGDSLEIDLTSFVRTHPTVGPLYGEFKLQADIFKCDMRLYNRQLHNNKKGIGNHMEDVIFPTMSIVGNTLDYTKPQMNSQQINQSSLVAYLGLRGLGRQADSGQTSVTRTINAMPALAYYEIAQNYYANLQEDTMWMITTPEAEVEGTIEKITLSTADVTEDFMNPTGTTFPLEIINGYDLRSKNMYITGTSLWPNEMGFWWMDSISNEQIISFKTVEELKQSNYLLSYGGNSDGTGMLLIWNGGIPTNGSIVKPSSTENAVKAGTSIDLKQIQLTEFDLKNIDNMRETILAAPTGVTYSINTFGALPYSQLVGNITGIGNSPSTNLATMNGLAIKTYNSDRFNNWLNTEWLDGPNGVNAVTRIDTSDGSFSMDTLNLSQKLYNLLNRIAVSGGSYKDWQEAVYGQKAGNDCEVPVYCGGYSAKIRFNEVVSTADAEDPASGEQALGVLGGRGTQTSDKGGKVKIYADEPCIVMGIVSLTPMVDYSQGNRYYMNWETMNDLHKPELDQIGFQELITDEMAAFDTTVNSTGEVTFKSAGKQPAYIEYMTNVGQCYGNFALGENEAFMTLQRDYQADQSTGEIKNLTTYIDPTMYNGVFATTDLASQHFWTQLGVGIKARRKMSAKMIPNL